MQANELDLAFAKLISEAEAFKKAKASNKSQSTRVLSQPSEKPASARRLSLEEMHAKRVAELKALSEGMLPGGWELECLTAGLISYQCTHCGARTEAMQGPSVFVVHRQTRHPTVKHMRPLRPGELAYFRTIGLKLRTERFSFTVDTCQLCLEEFPS